MQDADDQQDAAHPASLEPHLGGQYAQPPGVPRLEADREKDVRREDQVVDDVRQHDVALAGPFLSALLLGGLLFGSRRRRLKAVGGVAILSATIVLWQLDKLSEEPAGVWMLCGGFLLLS